MTPWRRPAKHSPSAIHRAPERFAGEAPDCFGCRPYGSTNHLCCQGGSVLRRRLRVVLKLAVMWSGALATMLLLPLAMYAVDDCAYGNRGLLCTRRGQHLGVGLPWLVAVAVTTAASAGALGLVRRRRTAFWCWAAGVPLLWVVMLTIATRR